MVEIFKTNVTGKRPAGRILKALHLHLPGYAFNFDLEDCDRILRVQSNGCELPVCDILAIVRDCSAEIYLFED